MFTLWRGWFLTDTPYDCFYLPFLLTSGPIVYFVAHYLQHFSEHLFPPSHSVMLPWNVVPGLVCLVLGGIQWWLIGHLWLRFRERK